MSSTAASSASTIMAGYIDRVYDQNMKESEAAYAAHLKASKELHQATVAMMRSRHAASALRAELDKANAAAASATETVDRKRKAADEAAADFDSCARIARHCYGRPTTPVYSKASKALDSKAAEEHESQDPYGGETPCYNPVSKDYVPQNPCASPVYHVNSPKGYCSVTGEPIYSPNEVTKPRYSATSPTYTPQSPSPIPLSPHVIAAAKRAGLRWGK